MGKNSYTFIVNWMGEKRRMFKFLLYFVIVNILVSSLIGTLLYTQTAKVLEKQSISENKNALTQISKSMDVLLNQVDHMLSQMALDPEIYKFMDYYKSNDVSNQLKISDGLNNLLLFNDYIHSVKLLFPNDQKVFYLNNGVSDFKDFYDQYIIEKVLTNNHNIFGWIPSRTLFDYKTGQNLDVMTVIKPIPQVSYNPSVVAVVDIDKKYIGGIIQSLTPLQDMQVVVVDKNSNIIINNKQDEVSLGKYDLSSISKQEKGYTTININHKQELATFETSELYGWKYISLLPYRTITKEIDAIKFYTIYISLSVIVLGFILSFFFSTKLYKAINIIEKNVSRLLVKSEKSEKTLAGYMPILKNNFLVDLLRGQIIDKEEIDNKLVYYGIDKAIFDHYFVYVISIERILNLQNDPLSSQTNITNASHLTEAIEKLVNRLGGGITVHSDVDEIAVIANLSGQFEGLAMEIHKKLVEYTHHPSTIAVGRQYSDVVHISDSYNEGLEALQYRFILGMNKIIYYDEIKAMNEENYNYPYKKENKLICSLKQGDFMSVLKLQDEIFKEFISGPSNNFYKSAYYCMQLLCSITRSIYEMGMDMETIYGKSTPHEDLLMCNGIIEIHDWFKQLCKKIIVSSEQRKENKNNIIAESLETYIRENYDKDLSLQNLSQQVYMSVSYLSKIYKEETGKSLKHFVNEVRIERAKELLEGSKYKIAKIGEKVGYNNVHSFLKLFKENVGMTPSEYRTTCINGEEFISIKRTSIL